MHSRTQGHGSSGLEACVTRQANARESDHTTQEMWVTAQETTQETDPTTQEKILALLRAKSEISQRLIAQSIGNTQSGLTRPEWEPESRPESQLESQEPKVEAAGQ